MAIVDDKLPVWLHARAARLGAAVLCLGDRMRLGRTYDARRLASLLSGGLVGTSRGAHEQSSQFLTKVLRRGIARAPRGVPFPTLSHIAPPRPGTSSILLTGAAKVALATPPPVLAPLLSGPVEARAAFALVGLSAYWLDETPPSPRELGYLFGVIDAAPRAVLIPVYDTVLKWVETGAFVSPLVFASNVREIYGTLNAQRKLSADDVWREAWKRREWRLAKIHGAHRLGDALPAGALKTPRRLYRSGPRARWDGVSGNAPTTQIELFWP